MLRSATDQHVQSWIKVKRGLLVVGAVLPWAAVAQRSDDPATWSTAQWAAWRDAQIESILTPTFESGEERVLSRAEVVARANSAYKALRPLLERPGFLDEPARRKALSNFARFVIAQHWMAVEEPLGAATNVLGMNVSDKEYWSYARPYLVFPDLLKSQTFLGALRAPSTYGKAIDMIAAHNAGLRDDRKWIAFPFRAQFIRSVDRTTYGRLLVVIPNEATTDGKLLDRWVMFAIATPDMTTIPEVRSVSMVATLRDLAHSGRSQAFMADFLREADAASGTISIRPNFLLTPNPSKNCFDCHKSAVLPIRPKTAYRFDAQGKMVEERGEPTTNILDRLIEGYGKSDLGHLDGDGYGPTLGEADRVRTDAFISGVTQDLPLRPSSYERIRESMKCGACHEEIGRLNYPLSVPNDRDTTSFDAKEGMLKTFIEKGYMPPHNTLTAEERTALWRCLSKEYFDPGSRRGTLVDWLRGMTD